MAGRKYTFRNQDGPFVVVTGAPVETVLQADLLAVPTPGDPELLDVYLGPEAPDEEYIKAAHFSDCENELGVPFTSRAAAIAYINSLPVTAPNVWPADGIIDANNSEIQHLAAGTTPSSAATVAQVDAGDAATLVSANAYTDTAIIDTRAVLNVKDFGAVGDATAGLMASGTDDTTAIQTALNAASASGSTVVFPEGTYRVDSPMNPITTSGVRLEGESATINWTSTVGSEALFSFEQVSATVGTLSGAMTRGDNEIATASVIPAGSLVSIMDGDYFYQTSIRNNRMGELLQTEESSPSTLSVPALFSYDSGHAISVITPNVESGVSGLRIIGSGTNNGTLAIDASGCVDFSVRDCSIEHVNAGVRFSETRRTQVTNNSFYSIDQTGSGYGVAVSENNYGSLVSDNVADKVRHFVTTVGESGVSRGTLISGNKVTRSKSGAIDTHAQGYDTTISGNHISDSLVGIQVRSPRTAVIGNVLHNCHMYPYPSEYSGSSSKNSQHCFRTSELGYVNLIVSGNSITMDDDIAANITLDSSNTSLYGGGMQIEGTANLTADVFTPEYLRVTDNSIGAAGNVGGLILKTPQGLTEVQINGNTLERAPYHAISVQSDGSAHASVVVSSNSVDGSDRASAGNYGIRVKNSTKVMVSGNTNLHHDLDKILFLDTVTTATVENNSGMIDMEPQLSSVTTYISTQNASYLNVKDFGAIGDGVTDDTDAIIAANAAGTFLVFPADSTFLVQNWVPVAGTTISAMGATINRYNDTTNSVGSSAAVIVENDDVQIIGGTWGKGPLASGSLSYSGSILIDGGSCRISDALFKDTWSGIFGNEEQNGSNMAEGVLVTNCVIRDCSHNVWFSDIKELTFSNNISHGSSRDGVRCYRNTENITIVNNHIFDNGNTDVIQSQDGIDLFIAGTKAVVTGNFIHDNVGQGIDIKISDTFATVLTDKQYVVSGNFIYDNGLSGVSVEDGTAAESKIADPMVSGNHIYGNTWHGVILKGTTRPKVTDNYIYNNVKSGVRVEDSADLLVSGNHIENNGTGAASGHTLGLHVLRTTGGVVTGNIFRGSATQVSGMNIDDLSSLRVLNNDASGHSNRDIIAGVLCTGKTVSYGFDNTTGDQLLGLISRSLSITRLSVSVDAVLVGMDVTIAKRNASTGLSGGNVLAVTGFANAASYSDKTLGTLSTSARYVDDSVILTITLANFAGEAFTQGLLSMEVCD